MSIVSEISRITGNIEDAYDVLAEMGATIPATPNSANLVAAIQTIPSGPVAQPIYGVSGLAASSSALTRTDDAVNMSFVIDSATGAVVSDFDNVFPWNEAEVVMLDAGKFLLLPDMYFRVGVNANSEITDIAVSKSPTNEGDWYKVDSFYYGCYGISSVGGSVSGFVRSGGKTRAEFRSYASEKGNDYFQLDLYHHTVMIFLWLIEWATENSQSIMTGRISGSGTSGGSTVRSTGGTDGVTTPSGFETAYGQMRYHYIEDFVGNLFEFVDGICIPNSGSPYYVTDDPSKFADTTTNMEQTSYNAPSSNWILTLGWDDDNPFMVMPITTGNGASEVTGFCDYVYVNGSAYPVLYVGAHCENSNVRCGVFFSGSNTVSYSGWDYGARLLKKGPSPS